MSLSKENLQISFNAMLSEMITKMGLSLNEAKVYLATLKLGSQTASAIAKESGVNRVTIYDTFEKLIQKGLATKTDKGSATYFQVISPKNLMDWLEREKNEFTRKIESQKIALEEILPAIMSLENPTSTKPKVRFYEGEKGIREASDDIMAATENVRSYINVEEMKKYVACPDDKFYKKLYEQRKKAGISSRTISPDNEASIERSGHDKDELRVRKFVSKNKCPFAVSTLIYNNKIITISYKEKMAVMVESKEIADFHKMVFDLLWESLK